MIVSFPNRFIYIAVPRTGSTATFHSLEQFGAAVVRYRPSTFPCYAQDTNGFHEPYFPDELAGFFKFATFRNPYTRMVSHYLMAKSDEKHRLHGLAACSDFPRFVEMAIFCKFLKTQVDFLDRTEVDARIYMEGDLGAQLSRLAVLKPGPVVVPKVNASTYDRPWYAHYDKQTASRVLEWGLADFGEFGYSMDFEDAVQGKMPVPREY